MKHLVVLSFVSVSILLVLGAILFNRAQVRTVFEVTGHTEVVSGVLAIDPQNPSTHLLWALSAGDFCAGKVRPRRPQFELHGKCDRAFDSEFEAESLIEIGTPLEFTIERVADQELRIDLLASKEDGHSIAKIYTSHSAAQPVELPSPLSLVLPINDESAPVSMPLVAKRIQLGREISIRGLGPQPVLRSGFVHILGRNISGERIFIARTIPLHLGDVVSGQIGSEQDLISAIVRVGSTDSLDAIFRLSSEELNISGLFTEPRIERLNRLDQIRNDNLLIALWSVVGLLVAVMSIGAFIKIGAKDEA